MNLSLLAQQMAGRILNKVWDSLPKQGAAQLPNFPRYIVFLTGAPGAGKETHTPAICQEMGITAPPVVMSALFDTPADREFKAKGINVLREDDPPKRLLQELSKPEYQNGVLVDGFPRTAIQCEIIKLLYQRLEEMGKNPNFQIVMLYVNSSTSVERQLERGRQAAAQGKRVRSTDSNQELAIKRYKDFMNQTHNPLIFSFAYFREIPLRILETYGSIEQVDNMLAAALGQSSGPEL